MFSSFVADFKIIKEITKKRTVKKMKSIFKKQENYI